MQGIDLEDFVATARFGRIAGQVTSDVVREIFGEPDMAEKGRKKRGLRYGDVEFWFWWDRLTSVGFTLFPGEPVNGGPIAVTGFWPEHRRTMGFVRELLESRRVSWAVDPRMSGLNPEEDSQTWVTEEHVHLAFFNGTLQRAVEDFQRIFAPPPDPRTRPTRPAFRRLPDRQRADGSCSPH